MRWFDGTQGTVRAVPADQPAPDRLVELDWDGRSPEQKRRDEQFRSWDTSVAREGEQPYDGGGGANGVLANRLGRAVMRYGSRSGPANSVRWMAGLTIVLSLLAWGDHRHRLLLVVLAVPCLVATVIAELRRRRERSRWRELGRHG